MLGVGLQPDSCQTGGQLGGRKLGQQYPTHRGVGGGQPGADRQLYGHQPVLGGGAGDINHFVAVEDTERGGLVDLPGHVFQIRLDHGAVAVDRQKGMTQLQHLGGQLEMTVLFLQIIQRMQGQQKAAGLGPVHAGFGRHFAQGHTRAVLIERL